MKTFAEYLTESKQTFDYRIKIAGDVDKDVLDNFERHLAQFDVVNMTSPKTSPIMKSLPDFPGIENDRQTVFDVSFNYPATTPQVEQIAKLIGLDINRILMQQKNHADSIDAERAKQEQNKDLLTNTDYPSQTAEEKALHDEHTADPDKHEAVVANEYKSEFTIAGGSTPAAKTTNDYPTQDKSPIPGNPSLPEVKSAAR